MHNVGYSHNLRLGLGLHIVCVFPSHKYYNKTIHSTFIFQVIILCFIKLVLKLAESGN